MGRTLVDMSELEYSIVSTVVVAAVVHYTRLARVVRGRNLSFDNGILLFHIFISHRFLHKALYFDFDTLSFYFI